MRKTFLLFALIFVFVISLSGCGDKKEVSGDKKESAAEENKDKQSDPSAQTSDQSPNTVENTDPSASESEKANELGMTPGMPANFPADVPQPKNAKVIGSLTSTDGTMVTFESTEKVQSIIDYYKEEMEKNGYQVSEDGELITPDKGGLIDWKKGTKEVQLVLGYDKDKGLSSLVITYK